MFKNWEAQLFKKFQNLNKKIPLMKEAFLVTHDPSKWLGHMRGINVFGGGG